MIFVDSNVVLDVVTADPNWKMWSLAALESAASNERLLINDIVYAELSVKYSHVGDVDDLIAQMTLSIQPMSRPALFLAGKTYKAYRSAGGVRTSILPDFFIGAQALEAEAVLLTRDPRRYRTYFPRLKLVAPT